MQEKENQINRMGIGIEKVSKRLAFFFTILLLVCMIVCAYVGFRNGFASGYTDGKKYTYDFSGNYTEVNNTALINEIMERQNLTKHRNPYFIYARVIDGDVVMVIPFQDKGPEFFEKITGVDANE